MLNPLSRVDANIMDDADLAGPFVFCFAFAFVLLLVSSSSPQQQVLPFLDPVCERTLADLPGSLANPNSLTSTASVSSAPSPYTSSST